jgi:hypothetical protein
MSAAAQIVERWLTARSFPMPREMYLPDAARGKEPLLPEGTDLAIWLYDAQSPRGPRPCAIGFVAKQSKPLFHHSYVNENQRQQSIDKAIESRKATFAEKERRKQEKLDFKHEFDVGDILVSSWGYDQTNVEFFQVTKVLSPKMIEIRAIMQEVERSATGADYVVAVKDKFVQGEKTLRKLVSPGHNVKLTSYSYAHKWDGKPQYQTASGYGH